MAHVDKPSYLGRLAVRFPKGFNPNSHKRDATPLRAQYKDTSNIRSKYKGIRNSWLRGHYTSGIPIFGNEDAVDRAGWSTGHVKARQVLEKKLLNAAKKGGVSTRNISAENSHALGHGDYGTDHELSAPAASKAQNTEQLAIELAMREAARKLNQKAKLTGDQSLVHAKITDVLHPETGHLLVRRFKLIRRADAKDHEGTVVFDHLMDGERLQISKDEAYGLGKKVHDALMNKKPDEAPRDKATSGYRSVAPVLLGGRRTQRKGMGGVLPPSGKDLRDHQETVLETLQGKKRALKKKKGKAIGSVADRRGVEMVGPAFTDARFPTWKNKWGTTRSGQDALDMQRSWMQGHLDKEGDGTESYEMSGSLPADDRTTLLKHIEKLETNFHPYLKSSLKSMNANLAARPKSKTVKNHGKKIDRKFDTKKLGSDKEREGLLDSTTRAVRALRNMEAEEAGSGIAELTPKQKKLLKAAHFHLNHIIGERRAVLDTVEEASSDEDEKKDGDD
ncbi:MAG: hypothetical protein ABJN40_17915 [Sneathiella sp.]